MRDAHGTVPRNRRILILAAMALSMVTLVSDASPAIAAFPGKNGRLVFSADGDIAVASPDGTGFRFLTSGPEDDSDPSWSADGAWIVFVRDGVIHTMRASGTHIRSTDRRGTDPRWFPDGTSIVFDDFDVRTMRPDGSRLRVLFDSTAGQTWQDRYHDASYSHDGTIAVTHTQDAVDSYFSAIESDIGDDCPMNSERAEFSPEGRWLAITGQGQLCVTNGNGEQFLVDEWYSEVAWSPDGRFLATEGGSQIVRPDGTLVRELEIGGTGIDWRPVCTIRGTPGDDVLYGTASSDVICAFAGNDSVFAGGGSDTVYGGSGDDLIRGDGGGDVLFGGWGRDAITGGEDSDVLNGGPALDTCRGGAGVDRAIACSTS